MKKKLLSLICFVLTCTICFSVLSVDVFARTYSSRRSSSSGIVLVIQIILMIVVAIGVPILKTVSKKSSGNSKKSDPHVFKPDFDKGYRDGFGNSGRIEDILIPRNSDGLTEDEQLMVDMFSAQAKARKPDPVEIKCPNCGAPVMLSDKVVCPYCRTEISNRAVAKYLKLKINENKDKNDRVIIPQKDYNPNRYYDENVTGYGMHDLKNEDKNVSRSDFSFDNRYGFRDNDHYYGTDQPVQETKNSYNRRNNSAGSNSDWETGFLGGYSDGDHGESL